MKEHTRGWSRALLVLRPGATLRGLLPVTVKNDTAFSFFCGFSEPEDDAAGRGGHKDTSRGTNAN